jgi:hypothetical protein
VRQHIDGFAAEHQRRNAASTVGGHHDQVAAIPYRRVDNGQVRLFVLGVDDAATHADVPIGLSTTADELIQ